MPLHSFHCKMSSWYLYWRVLCWCWIVCILKYQPTCAILCPGIDTSSLYWLDDISVKVSSSEIVITSVCSSLEVDSIWVSRMDLISFVGIQVWGPIWTSEITKVRDISNFHVDSQMFLEVQHGEKIEISGQVCQH